jgi:hypothetical protein
VHSLGWKLLSVIIGYFASKSPSSMRFGVLGLRRAWFTGFVAFLASFALLSCGNSRSSSAQKVSGLNFRAFVSQDVSVGVSTAFPTGVGAGLIIIDASKDVRSAVPITTTNLPGLLIEADNKKITLAYGASDNTVAIVTNASETSSAKVTLPGATESIVISPDASTGYAAVSDAALPGQSPGAIEVMNLSSAVISTAIPIVSAHYVVESHNGNRLLVFGDNSNAVTMIATSNVPTCTPICVNAGVPPCPPSAVTCQISGFDHPLWAVFSSDDNTAYVLNCGPECGGVTASIQAVDMTTQSLLGPAVPVEGATTGLLNGSTLYVAGTPPTSPGNACSGSSTAAPTCGRLDVVNLSSMRVENSQVITDGYHNRIDLSQNGQLFIGARTCTNVNNGSEVRGCLSIFNTLSPAVVIPPLTGDVTGLQAITNRNVEYVVEGGELRIFDTTADKLGPIKIDVSGQAIDVKLVDF